MRGKEFFDPWDLPDSFGKKQFYPVAGQTHTAQWPLKITRVSSTSPYFHKAHLLIAADCTAYAYSLFHQNLLRGRLLTICCPDNEKEKLTQKIEEVIRLNDISSIRVIRMDAPCCGGFADIIVSTVMKSRKDIPLQITTVHAEGENVEACGEEDSNVTK